MYYVLMLFFRISLQSVVSGNWRSFLRRDLSARAPPVHRQPRSEAPVRSGDPLREDRAGPASAAGQGRRVRRRNDRAHQVSWEGGKWTFGSNPRQCEYRFK